MRSKTASGVAGIEVTYPIPPHAPDTVTTRFALTQSCDALAWAVEDGRCAPGG